MIGMIAFLVLLGMLVPLVGGYSAGAGSCTGGVAPVAGKHLDRAQVTSGTLEAYGITITLGWSGNALEVGVPFDFEYGKPHFLTMSCDSEKPYKGFLVRLSSPDVGIDTTMSLLPFPSDSETQVEDTCINTEGVGGLTHTNSGEKSISQSTLEMDKAAQGLILDVTVVVANAGFYSDFYYSQYILNAVAPRGPGNSPTPGTKPTSSDYVLPNGPKDVGTPPPKDFVPPKVTVPTTPDVVIPQSSVAEPTVTVPTTPDVVYPQIGPTVAGLQDITPAGAPSGASSRRGTTGFTTYATLLLLVFTSFFFAF